MYFDVKKYKSVEDLLVEFVDKFEKAEKKQRQEMKDAYYEAFESIGNKYIDFHGKICEREGNKNNTFPWTVERVLKIRERGVKVELIGRWFWATGDIQGHEVMLLMKAGFHYSREKQAYFKKDDTGYHSKNCHLPLNKIREIYGRKGG